MRESKLEIAYKAKMRRIEIKGRQKLRRKSIDEGPNEVLAKTS